MINEGQSGVLIMNFNFSCAKISYSPNKFSNYFNLVLNSKFRMNKV